MIPPAIPANELQRLQALYECFVLDTPPDERFDRVTRLCQKLLDCPICVISLVDAERQWFKSICGLEGSETPRDVSFCGHAILQDDIFEIPDARNDPRFVDNPAVTGFPHVVFYAGAPLQTPDGFALGTLCVIDHRPRTLDPQQRRDLRDLANCAADQILLIRALRDSGLLAQNRAQLQRLSLVARQTTNGVIVTDQNGRVEWANEGLFRIAGYHSDDLEGRLITNVMLGEDTELQPIASMHLALRAGREFAVEYFTYAKSGKRLRLRVSGSPITGDGGELQGFIILHTDVTREYNDNENLRAAQRRLTSIIDGTRTGTWEWNVPTGETQFNERWAEMIGYGLEELQPISIQTWRRLAHPDDLRVSDELMQRHFARELNYYDCKCRMLHKDGHWIWVHTRGRVTSWAEDGTPLLMSGTHLDITELMVARQTLEEQQQQLRAMLSHLPGAVYRSTKEHSQWRMQFISDAVQQLLGYASETFLRCDGTGITLADLVHPEDKARFQWLHNDEGYKSRVQIEYRLRRADGHYRWVQELASGMLDSDGRVQHLDGFIWDITEKKLAELQLAEQQQKLASIYEMVPVGIVLNRYEDGSFIEGNLELHRMLGYTPEEFRGLPYQKITPDQWRQEDERQVALFKASGRYGPYEKQFLCKDGKLLDVALTGVMVTDAHGNRQVCSIVQDISSYKQLEKMKSELVAVVSHELRTPLTSVVGALGLVKRRLAKEGEVGRYGELFDIAYNNCFRLNMLVNDLLDMEKLMAGKMTFKIVPVYLQALLQQAVQDNRGYAEQYQVRMTLGAMNAQWCIAVDTLRFQQIMSNLLSNAIKYSPIEGEIEIGAQQVGDSVRISVRDHGPGIPLDYHNQLFQKFSQADSSTTRKKEGTGLGLAITRDLVERMDGAIGFDSVPGQGACFYITFPLSLHCLAAT